MMVTHVLLQKKVLLSMFFVVIGGFFVAACGASRSSSTTGPTPPSPTPTLAIVPGSGAAYGCPSDVVVSIAPAASDITLEPQQAATTINVKKGVVLEVHMPFGVAWQGPDNDSRCAPTAKARRICLEGESLLHLAIRRGTSGYGHITLLRKSNLQKGLSVCALRRGYIFYRSSWVKYHSPRRAWLLRTGHALHTGEPNTLASSRPYKC